MPVSIALYWGYWAIYMWINQLAFKTNETFNKDNLSKFSLHVLSFRYIVLKDYERLRCQRKKTRCQQNARYQQKTRWTKYDLTQSAFFFSYDGIRN